MTDTERIDLDELDVAEDETEQSTPSRGDWLWSEDQSEPSEEASEPTTESAGSDLIVSDEGSTADPEAGEDSDETAGETDAKGGGVAGGTESDTGEADAESDGTDADIEGEADAEDAGTETTKTADAIPRVPRQNDDKPVGIPAERGGAGAGPGAGGNDRGESGESHETGHSAEKSGEGADGDQPPEPRPMSTADYHDADVDDMTMALTFNAAQQLADPALAIAEARQWADWIGIVGDVPAHRINKFQRDNRIDADFFNGSGTDPGERLGSIDHNSMFFAERLAVVGVAGEDEAIAEAADWEFVPFSEAAAKADWELKSE